MPTISGFADEISPDPVEQCRVLADLGVGWLELRSAWGVGVLDLDDGQVRSLRRLLDRAGLRVSSIGSPIGKIGIGDDFDPHLVRFARALEMARAFDTPNMRIFSFYIPVGADPGRFREEVLRRLGVLVQRAEAAGVVLLHENEKHIYGDLPERCADIVASLDSDHLRLVWDPANFVQCGVRPFTDAYAMLRPHVAYLHVKDAFLADGTVVPAGQGDGQVPPTLAALRDDGFDGFLSLEPHLAQEGPAAGSDGEAEFRRAHRALTDILAGLHVDYA